MLFEEYASPSIEFSSFEVYFFILDVSPTNYAQFFWSANRHGICGNTLSHLFKHIFYHIHFVCILLGSPKLMACFQRFF